MKKIKIGHVGTGHMHSEGKMECVRRFPEIFEVVGIAEEDEQSWKKNGSRPVYAGIRRMSVEDLLSIVDMDAVMVECDDWNLMHYAQKCADAGKHMHVDKPAGESIPDFVNLMRTAKKKGLVVQMAYMYRYNPAIVKALEMARSGQLGDILQADAIMSTEHAEWIREWLRRFQGGTMHTFGCHLVDLMLLFQGMPESIAAFLKKTALRGINDVNDHDLAVFSYPRGVSTVRTSSFEVNGYGRRQIVICGSEASIEIKPLETNIVKDWCHMYLSTKAMTAGKEYKDVKEQLPMPAITGRYDEMMKEFACCVRGEMENPFTYEYELSVQRACLAACGFDVNLKEEAVL